MEARRICKRAVAGAVLISLLVVLVTVVFPRDTTGNALDETGKSIALSQAEKEYIREHPKQWKVLFQIC